MSYVTVGSCPKCGAPIYSPSMWHGIYPPPPIYTCVCVAPQYVPIIATNTADKGRAHEPEEEGR